MMRASKHTQDNAASRIWWWSQVDTFGSVQLVWK